MFSDDERNLAKMLPGDPLPEYMHIPQPDGSLVLKRSFDCTRSDWQAHLRWMNQVMERGDPDELEFVAQFYGETPDRHLM